MQFSGKNMANSLLNPQTCGFAKVAAYSVFKKTPKLQKAQNEGTQKFKARILQTQCKEFEEVFKDRASVFKPNCTEFFKSAHKLKRLFVKWNKDDSNSKKVYEEHFSIEKWIALSKAKKEQHTLSKCKGCYHNFPKLQSSFPVKSKHFYKSAKENPFFVAVNIPPPKSGVLQDMTKELYNSVNKGYERISGITFGEGQAKYVPEAGVQLKKSPTEIKSERRQIFRKVKSKIENEWKRTSVER